jgi:hypothetical protein
MILSLGWGHFKFGIFSHYCFKFVMKLIQNLTTNIHVELGIWTSNLWFCRWASYQLSYAAWLWMQNIGYIEHFHMYRISWYSHPTYRRIPFILNQPQDIYYNKLMWIFFWYKIICYFEIRIKYTANLKQKQWTYPIFS